MHQKVFKTGDKIHPFLRLCRAVCKYFVMAHRIRILPSIAECVVFCEPNRRYPGSSDTHPGGDVISKRPSLSVKTLRAGRFQKNTTQRKCEENYQNMTENDEKYCFCYV